jgi:hypothetical protein
VLFLGLFPFLDIWTALDRRVVFVWAIGFSPDQSVSRLLVERYSVSGSRFHALRGIRRLHRNRGALCVFGFRT